MLDGNTDITERIIGCLKVGLVMNFNSATMRAGIKRVVLNA